MTVSIGNGVDIGNLVTSEIDPVTGVISFSASGKTFPVQKRPPLIARPKTVSADAPTITYSTTTPGAGNRNVAPWMPTVRPVGAALEYNNSYGMPFASGNTGFCGIDCILTGDTITFGWRCAVAQAEKFMFYIDGYPVSLTPASPSVTTSGGGLYFVTLSFASVATRRVEIIGTLIGGFYMVSTPYASTVQPAPRKRTVHIVGDSFQVVTAALSTYDQTVAAQIATNYDCAVSVSGMGGTGYKNVNGASPVFGDAARVNVAALIQPDDIVFVGSLNDDVQTGIYDAALACFAAYKVACPTANIIVFGPEPDNATTTIGDARKANCAAVQAAAQAFGAAYYDMIGFSYGTPTAFALNTAYQPGAVVSHLGSLWRMDKTVATTFVASNQAPGNVSPGWTLLTYDLYGTGRVGATAGDGSRDTLLHSDNVHPTVPQCRNIARRIAAAVALGSQ